MHKGAHPFVFTNVLVSWEEITILSHWSLLPN